MFIQNYTKSYANKWIFIALFAFLGVSLLSRITLEIYGIIFQGETFFVLDTLKAAGIGLLYDFISAFHIIAILSLLGIILWPILRISPYIRIIAIFCVIYFFILVYTAEIVFWDEFHTRFNFIAVDYLIYTHEVLQNIRESYPIIETIIITILAAVIITIFYLRTSCKWIKTKETIMFPKVNIGILILFSLLSLISDIFVSEKSYEIKDRFYNELAHNGLYNLFAAYRNNTIDYEEFYKTIPTDKAFEIIRSDIKSTNINDANDRVNKYSLSRYIDNTSRNDGIINSTVNQSKSKKKNIILIIVESLSAEFLGSFGNTEKLTPFLDEMQGKSLFFTNYYATGTRTVRGLEAITLSVPPAPGNSIVRSPSNNRLFSIGSVLNERYSLKYFYGGYSYFDNMKHFYTNNYFEVIDRSDFSNDEISFSNVWGVCDRNVYNKVVQNANKEQKPFFYIVMTTSNHRPFTYESNKIDIASGTGRNGAVKYTDFALREFFNMAEKEPWFDDTIFVITADHCALSAGKTTIDPNKYHIPLFIYSPKIIKQRTINSLSSQIDLAPTLMGLLGISYKSEFYGQDLLRFDPHRAFMGTYQKVAMYDGHYFIELSPQRGVDIYKNSKKELDKYKNNEDGIGHESINLTHLDQEQVDKLNSALIDRTVAYYQTADYLKRETLK